MFVLWIRNRIQQMKDCLMARNEHKHDVSWRVLMSSLSICIWHIHHNRMGQCVKGHMNDTVTFTTVYSDIAVFYRHFNGSHSEKLEHKTPVCLFLFALPSVTSPLAVARNSRPDSKHISEYKYGSQETICRNHMVSDLIWNLELFPRPAPIID